MLFVKTPLPNGYIHLRSYNQVTQKFTSLSGMKKSSDLFMLESILSVNPILIQSSVLKRKNSRTNRIYFESVIINLLILWE